MTRKKIKPDQLKTSGLSTSNILWNNGSGNVTGLGIGTGLAVVGSNLTSTSTGNTTSPATNTADYLPQWNGADSHTLKNGIPTSTFAPALGADDNYVTDAQLIVIGNTSGTNSGNETATTMGALIGGAGDATPNDTDYVATSLTAAGILKKITWTNVKAFLKTYFDTIYAALAGNVAQAFGVLNLELGHASDTTLSRVSAGKTAVEGVNQGTEGILQNSQSSAYTTVLTDAGKHLYHPSADTTARTWTIDSNANVAYPIGTAITFVNDVSAGVLTIAITSDTLLWANGAGTGSRTLAAASIATAIKITSTKWMISGSSGLT